MGGIYIGKKEEQRGMEGKENRGGMEGKEGNRETPKEVDAFSSVGGGVDGIILW